MLKNKTILYFIEYQPNKLGFTEIFALEMVRALVKEGCRVVLVFPSLPYDELHKKYIDAGAVIETFSRAHSSEYEIVSHLIRFIRKYRPDIVHTRHRCNFTLLPWFLKLSGAKKIILTQEYAWELGLIAKKNILKRNLLYLRNKITCLPLSMVVPVSKYVENCVIESRGLGQERIKVIYNGIDLDKYSLKDFRDNGSHGNPRYITAVSWVNRVKGLHIFLEACRRISLFDPEIRFLLVSYGGSDEAYQQQARELGISDKVTFLQNINDTEKIYSMSSIFVCPSIWQEAFGAVIPEAMACGIPVVATRVGGIPEIVIDKVTGILVPPGDSEAIADACINILNNDKLIFYMTKEAKKRVKDLFDQKIMVRETINLYSQVITSS